MSRLLIMSLLLDAVLASSGSKYGTFWQLTDIHYDSNYSNPLLAPSLCRSTEGLRNSSTGAARGGKFGDYNCDSPWSLVKSAISAMRRIEPNPDFILWTGDSVPHAPDAVLTLPKVLALMKNVTDLLRTTFPDVPIYPMLGNHDTWPSDQLPGSSDSYYKSVLKVTGWDKMLKDEQLDSFRRGGFYMSRFGNGLRLVLVNSNLWYYHDNMSLNATDPADHFQWLELLMNDAHVMKDKVLIAGHVPPGVFGRSANISWFRPTFNWRFHNLLQRYHEIIVAAIFGHEHADGFRVVYDIEGEPVIPMFMAPSVTPWFSTMPGVGSNNPGIRLYKYLPASAHEITDYTQYFVNLTAANTLGEANWVVEYNATSAFQVERLDATSLSDVIRRFDEEPDEKLFDEYYRHNSVGLDAAGKCRDACKRQQVCAAAEIDRERYSGCLVSATPHPATPFPWQRPHRHSTTTPDDHKRHRVIEPFTYFLLGALIMIILAVFVLLAICCCQRRHTVVLFSRSKYMRIEEV